MRFNRRWQPGEMPTAESYNEIIQRLIVLENMRGAGGIEVSTNATGMHIRANIPPSGNERRLAIARIEGDNGVGDWPSFLDWSECDGNTNKQQTIFDFEFVEPTSFLDEELPRPNYYFPYQGTGEFVRALNITEHFVPHYLGYSGYVTWLTKSGDHWLAEYSLPPVLRVNLEGDLYPDGSCLARATNYEIGNPTFRVYDSGFVPSDKKLSAGGVAMCELRRLFSQFRETPIWQYQVSEVYGCPVFSDGPPPDEEE